MPLTKENMQFKIKKNLADLPGVGGGQGEGGAQSLNTKQK